MMTFEVRTIVNCNIEAENLDAAIDKVNEMSIYDMLDVRGVGIGPSMIHDPETGEARHINRCRVEEV
jgi:hypothetical protein